MTTKLERETRKEPTVCASASELKASSLFSFAEQTPFVASPPQSACRLQA